MRKWTRRAFIAGGFIAAPALVAADAVWVEPQWIKVRTLRIGQDKPTHRVVHITDIHHKGDRAYFESVVREINRLSPDAVCFTGDLIEDPNHLTEALELLTKIKSPIYGVPGNHDYWSHADFDEFAAEFAKTGGAWLMDAQATTKDGKLHLTGVTCLQGRPSPIPPRPGGKNILLLHYPLLAEKVAHNFDLMLAGHSHGGQFRIPFYGAMFLLYWVGKYEVGMFDLKAGPLYVNPGIGYLLTSIRFNCRPEITVFEI